MKTISTSTPLLLASALALAALTPYTTAAPRAGQSVTIQTGTVTGAQAVNLQSAAAGGAIVGGVLGYATTSSRQSSSRRARNTLIGAAAGGILTNRAQGDLNGMQYSIQTVAGTTIEVVTDQTEIRIGDCVNVEQAGSGTANVRRVSADLCDAARSNAVDAEIRNDMSASADRCLAAKDRLLDAETEEQIEAAIRRVHILCDD